MKKVKIYLTMIIAALLLVLFNSLNVFALTEGDWEFQLLDNEVLITKYHGDKGNVVIPETLFGAKVTDIASNTFNNEQLTSVTIPSGIKVLPDFMFFGASNLTSVTLPEGMEVIGRWAFQLCTSLETIHLPSTVKHIKECAFNGVPIKEVNLHKGIEKIDGGVFAGTKLSKIDLNLLSPNCTIGGGLFESCEKLERVKLRTSDIIIPSDMFKNCTSLKDVELQIGTEIIGMCAFLNCTALKKIILPTTLKQIRLFCFNNTSLEEITIPYGTEFVDSSFRDCQKLKSVYIPDTVKSLDGGVISGSNNCILYCSSDSYATQICKEYKISHITDKSVNSLITVLYNDTRISFHTYDQNPELINDRTLVPLRSIFEAMGADVEWDGTTSTAIAKRDGIEVKIQIGANEIYKDGKAISVDVPATLLNDRTMVPVRVIAEAFGADVEWNGNGRAVLITE